MSISDPIAFTKTAWQAGPSSVGEPCVLLKLGEVVLKGRNRHQFEKLQQRNIKAAVKDTGLPTEVLHREGVVLVRVPRPGQCGSQPWSPAAQRPLRPHRPRKIP